MRFAGEAFVGAAFTVATTAGFFVAGLGAGVAGFVSGWGVATALTAAMADRTAEPTADVASATGVAAAAAGVGVLASGAVVPVSAIVLLSNFAAAQYIGVMAELQAFLLQCTIYWKERDPPP